LFRYSIIAIMGMLKRAMEWRKGATSFPMQDVEAIPEEDRRELLLEIDKVVAKNRIKITPELFVIKANKRGIMLPLAVNLVTLSVVAAALFGLYTLFRQEERGLKDERFVTASVEGMLIDEIRRESEAKVAEKEQEIDAIERRLQEIADQRNALQASMESRISIREEELRRELEAELEALRQKLLAEGASEAVIAEELRKLEEERTAFYEQVLTRFRSEAEAQRLESEENLRRLEQDAAENLRQMNEEREQLRFEMEERLAGSQEGLEAAQSEIALLTEQRNREAGISSQVLGLYLSLRESIRAGALDQADRTLAQLKTLLYDEAYMAVPSFRERRGAELFIVESLEKLLEEERRQLSGADEALEAAREAELSAAAEAEADLTAQAEARAETEEADRRLIAGAEALMAGGNYVEAVSAYLNLLVQYPDSEVTDQVPEGITRILRSYDQELANMQEEAARLAAVAEERSGTIGTLEERRRTLEAQLAEMESRPAETDQPDPLPDPLLQEELSQLREIEATISGLQQQYNNYLRSVDPETLTRGDENQLLSSKQTFDAFLVSPEAQEIMPGLLERIRIYDRAFERAGRRTALMDTVELVSELSMLTTPGERQAYLEKEKESLREPEMIDFLEELVYLIE
jgi:hypothetical protein